MTKARLEAFSDGVLAIIITIMVLEFKKPEGSDMASLTPLLPAFLSYILSFVFVGIYWGNHHHLLHAVKRVNSQIIWSNMGLLFTLSLVPFATAWMGENHFTQLPVALYGTVLLFNAIAYTILQKTIMAEKSQNEKLRIALEKQEIKGRFSTLLYIISIPCAFYYPWISASLYVIVAILWLVPDKRIEAALKEE